MAQVHPDRVVDELTDFARSLVGAHATVQRDEVAGMPTLCVRPVNPGSVELSIIGEQWLVLYLGHTGGRWELDYEGADVVLARELIRAAYLGRVTSNVTLAGVRTTATLADGSSSSRTLLGVSEGWIRRLVRGPRLVAYESYLGPRDE